MPHMPHMRIMQTLNPVSVLQRALCRFLVVDSHGGFKATPVTPSLRNQQTSWAALWATHWGQPGTAGDRVK